MDRCDRPIRRAAARSRRSENPADSKIAGGAECRAAQGDVPSRQRPMSARLLASQFQPITSPMHCRILIVLLAFVAIGAEAAPTKSPEPVPKPSPKPKPSVQPAIPVALPNYDEETSVKLQIFLDNNDFGPGKID